MTSIANPVHPKISFCPSSMHELFSVEHNGKTHKLSLWQQTAIVVTGVVGILLFGIGALFALGLSYYFRTKKIEQIEKSTATPVLPPEMNPEVVEPNREPAPNIIKAPFPGLQLDPMNPAADPMAAFFQGDPEADRQIAERMKTARGKIEAMTTNHKGIPTTINAIPLEKFSGNGRHFIHIRNGYSDFRIPEFKTDTLPRGIYCIYAASTPRIRLLHSAEMNQVMIDEFGAQNIYHIIIVNQTVEMLLERMHNHQLTLYTGNLEANRKNIKNFEERVAYKYTP
jgi:hypothetical protein